MSKLRPILHVFTTVSMFCLSFAQAPDTQWTHTYGGADNNYATSVDLTSDGGYVLGGTSGSSFYIVKTDEMGIEMWHETYSIGPYANMIRQTADGGYIVVGYAGGDVGLLKTDSLGSEKWTKQYNFGGDDYAWAVQQTNDNGYIVAGFAGINGRDACLLKTDSLGDTLWTKFYGTSLEQDAGYSVDQTYDGGYIVAGQTNSFGAGGSDFWLLKTAANGDTLWTRTYGGTGSEEARAVKQTPDKGYILAGHTTSYGSGGHDFYVVRTDSVGNILWERTYGGGGYESSRSVTICSDGGYLIAGFTMSFGAGNEDFWAVRIDGYGDTLWTQTYGGELYDRGREAQLAPDGGFVFAGETESFAIDPRDAYLVKIEPEGTPLPVPSAPYIVAVQKNSSDIHLTWNQVTTDTAGNPDTIDHYVIYRDTIPNYIVSAADSIGYCSYPETTFIDVNALQDPVHFYYLAKAVNIHSKRSKKSNMAYKLNRFFNENPTTTDINWTSLPWHSNYGTVSDLTDDLSPNGDPLTTIMRLRDDQRYESYGWNSVFNRWLGTDFAITSGHAYIVVTSVDTTLVLVGSNNPDGLIVLNENPTTTNRNLVAIPYNAAYSTISDITDEYSPNGNPLSVIFNRRDSQYFETWIWDDIFFEWFGANFSIVPGRGYDFVTTVDTTWNPTEYSNRPGKGFVDLARKRNQHVVATPGTAFDAGRAPVWRPEEILHASSNVPSSRAAADHKSHIVRCHMSASDDLVFTAYRPAQPYDVLTEKIIGCGIAQKDEIMAMWFDCGNFKKPWQDGEEVIIIVEALTDGQTCCNVLGFQLDKTLDTQDLGTIDLLPIYELIQENENVMGFSAYDNEVRLNDEILAGSEIHDYADKDIRPVIRGGYETVYSSQGRQSRPDEKRPLTYTFLVSPNPFLKDVIIEYAIPCQTHAEIAVYDVSGRRVHTISAPVSQPGYYSAHWDGTDDNGRQMSSGVYMLRFKTDDFTSTKKLVLLK